MPPLLRFIAIVACVEMSAAGFYNTIHYFDEGTGTFFFNFNWMAIFALAAVALWRSEPPANGS